MKLNEVKYVGLYYDTDDIYYTPENIYEVKNMDNHLVINRWYYDYSNDSNDYYNLKESFKPTDNIIDNKYNVDLLDILESSIIDNSLSIKLNNIK